MGNSAQNSWKHLTANKLIMLVLALIVAVPLVPSLGGNVLHGLPALVAESIAAMLLAVLLWRSDWKVERKQIANLLRTSANLPALGLLALAIVSCCFSAHKGYSIQETLRLGAGVIVYFIVAYQFRRSEQLAWLVYTLLIASAGAAVIGFVQFGLNSKEFATGVFGDHQLLGSFLVLMLPLCIVIAITDTYPKGQLIGQISAVLTGTCLLLAHSRSAWIAAAGALVVLVALAVFVAVSAANNKSVRKGFAQNKHNLLVPVLMLAVVSVLFLVASPQTLPIFQRAQTLKAVSADSTWQVRVAAWRGALEMVRQHPVTGVGIGLYPYFQHQYTHMGMALNQIGGAPSLGEQAHNVYLQTAAELGIPGLVLFVSVLVTFWVSAIVRLRTMENGLRRTVLIGVVASTVAAAIDGISSPSWQLPQVSVFLWIMLAVGTECLRTHSRRKEEESRVAPIPAHIRRPLAIGATLGALALLPTFVFADGNLYATPVSGVITPGSSTIKALSAKQFTYTVTFSDSSTRDVSLCNDAQTKTTFSYNVTPTAPSTTVGYGTGINNRTYQSRRAERSTVTVSATYQQTADPRFPGQVTGSVTTTNGATLTVQFP